MKTKDEINEILKVINEHLKTADEESRKVLQIEKQALLWVLGAGTLSETGKLWLGE